jgi:hypothetical protein
MDFEIMEVKLINLINWILEDKINLKPYYQRNDMWNRNDQEVLIDSILKGYPLPNFFSFKRNHDDFEMVDGQQRARTIFRLYKGQITDSYNNSINNINRDDFFAYKLNFTEIYNVKNNKEIERFYVLVNKRGKQLTTPEIHKAEFANTNFLKLVYKLLENQSLMNLNIFTEASSKRMNDRNFVEELASYLIYGIQDKKEIIERIYNEDISNEEFLRVEEEFSIVINMIEELNKVTPIKKTRYKQRNDFYTLFTFIHKHRYLDQTILQVQYDILQLIEPHISPSNEDCRPLMNYALNCVSQSNSKKARQKRLTFFEDLLLNQDEKLENNNVLAEIAECLSENSTLVEFKWFNNYYLINPYV